MQVHDRIRQVKIWKMVTKPDSVNLRLSHGDKINVSRLGGSGRLAVPPNFQSLCKARVRTTRPKLQQGHHISQNVTTALRSQLENAPFITLSLQLQPVTPPFSASPSLTPCHHSSPVFLRGLTFRISITVSSNQMMFAFRLWHTHTQSAASHEKRRQEKQTVRDLTCHSSLTLSASPWRPTPPVVFFRESHLHMGVIVK